MTAVATATGAARERLAQARRDARGLGGERAIAKQHAKGLLTARERVELLLDPDSEQDFGALAHAADATDIARSYGDGLLLGFGRVDGRPVAYAAADATVKGGSGGAGAGRRAIAFHGIVERCGLPLIDLAQAGGARVTDVMSSKLAGFGGSAVGTRRVHPRRHLLLTAVMGNYFAPWRVAMADVAVMTSSSFFSFTSPAVLEEATGATDSAEDIGGADIHARVTGQVDGVAEDDADAIAFMRRVLAYLPSNPFESAPVVRSGDPADRLSVALRHAVPESSSRAYDMRTVIREVVDNDSLLEFAPRFARQLVTGLARLDGHTVAVMANQPMHMAGTVDIHALYKAERLLRLAEACSLPVLSFVDIPGVLTTKEQEHQRLLSRVYEVSAARLRPEIPKLTVVVRKAIGFGYFLMNGSDPEGHTFAWPSAQIAFMGAEPAVRVAFREQLEASPDPRSLLTAIADQMRASAEPWDAARLGYVDDVIDPATTRPVLVRALDASRRNSRWL